MGSAPRSQVMSRSATSSSSEDHHDQEGGSATATAVVVRHQQQRPSNNTKKNTSNNNSSNQYPYIAEDRLMHSRTAGDRLYITHTIEPGKREHGCLTCCYSPDNCPYCVHFGCGGIGCNSTGNCSSSPGFCCDYPEYAVNRLNASRYILVRENSIEWNDPTLRYEGCCSNRMEVMDRVSVMYFDDSQFQEIRRRQKKSWCNLLSVFCCGGNGERLLIEKTCCCGLCLQGKQICCLFVPSCLGDFCGCCGCLARRTIWVEDAESAKRILSEARDKTKERLKV